LSLTEEENKEIQKYLDSVFLVSHSHHTVNSYRSGLNQFLRFVDESYDCSINEIISKIKLDVLDAYQVLKEFTIFLDKQGKRPATIKLWLTVVKGYFRHNSIKIYSEDFRQFVKIPKDVITREEPLTKEIITRLLRNVPAKLQTIILVAIASGMRIGEIVQIKISDIDFSTKPTKIRIRAKTTKTRESRETFLTGEATIALKDYLRRYYGWKVEQTNENLQDQIIFGRTKIKKQNSELKHSPVIVTENVLITSLKTHIKKIPELSRLSENGRMVIHFHAFRKFFYTALSNITGSNYAHALMGHHDYLDTYYNLPEEQKQELYFKAEPFLTISDYTKIEKQLVGIEQTQKDLQDNYLKLLNFFEKNNIMVPNSLLKNIAS